MSVRYLFNTNGEYVAFIQGGNVFSPDTEWIGFIANGNEFFHPNGAFVGYVLNDDRVARNRSDPQRPRRPTPLKPLKPLRPLRPLKRLRMERLPYPYEDVFAHGPVGPGARSSDVKSLDELEGARLYAADGTFLGKVTRNVHDSESMVNPYGTHGSRYSTQSIFNPYSPYGSPYGALSPYNKYSSTPPRFVKGTETLTYLSVNSRIKPRVEPTVFVSWLNGA